MRKGLVFFVLLSLAGFTPFVLQAWRDWRVFQEYEYARCTVLGIGSYESLGQGKSKTLRPELSFRVEAAGVRSFAYGFDNMNGRLASMNDAYEYRVGQAYPCWYDPADPQQAVLRRKVEPKFYALAGIPAFMLLISGSMLARARPRRVVLKGLTKGEVMAVRLAPDFTRRGRLGCSALMFVLSLAFIAFLVWVVIQVPALWFFLVGFLVMEAGVVRFFFASVRGRHVADPIVEIDGEPVAPGHRLRIYLRQPEPGSFDLYRVSVVCGRETDAGKPYRDQLLELTGTRAPLVQRLEATIPRKSIASRDAVNDSVHWRIVVERHIGKLKLDVDFAFRVWRDSGIHLQDE